jgi:glycine betaine/proline transport system substrate-binding protein
VGAGLLLAASHLPGQAADKVVIGELNWTGAVAIQHILAEVITTRLDGEVTFLAADLPVLFVSAGRNDGSVDVLPDIWMPNHATAWAKYVAPGSAETLVPTKNPYAGVQGFYIPGYIQDEHGVKSVEDLKKPEVAALFSSIGGKPEFLVGPAGWPSTYISEIKARDYGFAPNFELVSTETAVTYAKIDAASKTRAGALFYAYTPDWIFASYDLRRLEEPAFDGYAQENKNGDPQYNPNGRWKFVSPTEDPDWLNKSRITSAFPDAKVYVLHAKRLETEAPRIAAFLSNVAINPSSLNGLIKQIEQDKIAPVDAAKAWVQANKSTVDTWLAKTN